MANLIINAFALLCFALTITADRIIERDLYGEFVLEKATMPMCEGSLGLYQTDPTSPAGINAHFYGNSSASSTSCYSQNSTIVRKPAPYQLFGNSSSVGEVISSSSVRCSTYQPINYSEFDVNSTFPVNEPVVVNDSISFTAAFSTLPITVQDVRMKTDKRYIFVSGSTGHCVYSAPFLKRIDVRASYTLVRTNLLKAPPKYCKSTLDIGGIPGEVNASQLLFDGRPDPCLKGTFSFVQEHNITFPVVTKLAQGGIPYYGYSTSPLQCGKNFTYAGALKIAVDASLANVASIKGARYFGLADIGPTGEHGYHHDFLDNIRVCLYTSYNGQPSGVWGWIQSLFGW